MTSIESISPPAHHPCLTGLKFVSSTSVSEESCIILIIRLPVPGHLGSGYVQQQVFESCIYNCQTEKAGEKL